MPTIILNIIFSIVFAGCGVGSIFVLFGFVKLRSYISYLKEVVIVTISLQAILCFYCIFLIWFGA